MTLFETAALIAAAVNLVLAFFVYQQDVKLRSTARISCGRLGWRDLEYQHVFHASRLRHGDRSSGPRCCSLNHHRADRLPAHVDATLREAKLPRWLARFFYLLHAGLHCRVEHGLVHHGRSPDSLRLLGKRTPSRLYDLLCHHHGRVICGALPGSASGAAPARRRIRTMLLASFAFGRPAPTTSCRSWASIITRSRTSPSTRSATSPRAST